MTNKLLSDLPARDNVPPLVVIVGQTASGKSALALELAKRFDGEIISADSWAVRKELNIGTAKPDVREQKLVRHHLIDVVAPCSEFTAAVYKRLALEAISDIYSRRKLPIMAGGSGLYIDGVIYDFSFLAGGDRQKRESLNKLSVSELEALVKSAGYNLENIDLRNKRRLIRLLETGGKIPTKGKLRPNTLILGVNLNPEELNNKINKRIDEMISAGLEQEVDGLVAKYGWDCEGLKGIGYAEWKEYFAGKADIEETKAKIYRSSTSLAKRQRTWFKRNKSIQWVESTDKAAEILTTFLNKK